MWENENNQSRFFCETYRIGLVNKMILKIICSDHFFGNDSKTTIGEHAFIGHSSGWANFFELGAFEFWPENATAIMSNTSFPHLTNISLEWYE